MKKYTLFYAYYPFDMETVNPLREDITANNLNEAIKKLKKNKGEEEIEVFEGPARKHYNE
jgi:hypothetical protein